MGQDYESPGGMWSLLFDLLAVAIGSAVILLALQWLGQTMPILHRLGLV